jgi:hypothetical protein
MQTINIKIGAESVEVKWHSHMRKFEFAKLNSIHDEVTAANMFAMCLNAHKKDQFDTFKQIDRDAMRLKEDAIIRGSQIYVKQTWSAITTEAGEEHAHLVAELERKTHAASARKIEKLLMWKASNLRNTEAVEA